MKIENYIIIAASFILLVIFSLSRTLVHLLTELWWFNAVDFTDIFWTRLSWQIFLWVGAFVIYFLFLWGNYWIAEKLTSDRSFNFLLGTELAPYRNIFIRVIVIVSIILISLSASTATTTSLAWETLLKFLNAVDFPNKDPIYQKNISFYIFRLPLYEGIKDWLFTLIVAGLIISIIVYSLKDKFLCIHLTEL